MQILIAVDTLEFLHRGGRVSRAQKVAGGAVGVRPLLTLREGEVVPCGKVYGRRGAWRAFERFLAHTRHPAARPRIGIAHGHAERDAQRLVELVGRVSPQASVDRVCEIGPVVGHARRAGHARTAGAAGVMRGFAGGAEATILPNRSAPHPSHLAEPVAGGRALTEALAELRPFPVENVGDLLENVPFRHDDYRSSARLADLRPGEEATVVVTVERVRARPTRRRNLVIVEAAVRDASGTGIVVWFNQRYLLRQLQPGMRLSIRGERRPTIDAEIVAKSHEPAPAEGELLHTHGLVPVYRASERVSSRRLRSLVAERLGHAGDRVDMIPAAALSRRRLPLRRDALHALPPAADALRAWARPPPPGLRGALPPPARDAGPAPGRRGALAGAAAAARRRARRALPTVAPVPADGRPGTGERRDRRRSGADGADAPAAPGGCRIGQDGGRRARPPAGGRERRPGRADGADGDAGDAAPDERRRRLRAAGRAGGRPDAGDAGAGAAGGADGDRVGRAAGGGGHARTDPAVGRLRRPAGGGRRRAASVRRPAAAGARGTGRRRPAAARPAHDRDTDPAHARADDLRRPRCEGAGRDAAGTDARHHPSCRLGPPGRGVRAHAPAAGRGAPGVRRLPAGLGVRAHPGHGGRGRGCPPGRRRAPGLPGRLHPWPAAGGRAAGG